MIHGAVLREIKSSSGMFSASNESTINPRLFFFFQYPALTSPTPTSPDTVSWQSAYWTLLALSLNAMTQNSTLDRRFPSAILFPMRSSPLICAADVIEVLLLLLWYMYRDKVSAPYAARRVIKETTWQPKRNSSSAGNVSQAAESSSSNTLENQYPLAHTVLFVLGVLPQAMKLFGMRGIPWTQVWGGLYLSSYMVLAGVGALARRAGSPTDVPRSNLEAAFDRRKMLLLKQGVVAAQVGMWLWCMWRVLRPVWSSAPESTFFSILAIFTIILNGLVVMYVAFFIMILPVILAFVTERPSLIICCLVTGPFALWSQFPLMAFVDDLQNHHMDSVVTFWFLVMTVVFTLMVIASLCNIFPATFFKVSFGVGNLVFSILYYCFLYDPRGTVKPSWAKKLG
jgi:hypothetical protein